MPSSMDSELHHRLRQATRQCHHEVEHHPLLSSLLDPDVSLVHYGNALAALHGIYARLEVAVLTYLQQYPDLFDYLPRRKLPAMESDLTSLGRFPVPISIDYLSLDSVGALIGTLYTLEGSTLGGQFIAHELPAHFPLNFFTVYGEHTRRRWDEFLLFADARCPGSEYETAAATAVALFASIKKHLDDSQRYLGLA